MKLIFINCFLLLSTFLEAQNNIGGKRDRQGCLGAAGYQWSILSKNCIRPFELRTQLANVSRTFNCGILFSKDKKTAEIFSKEGNFILLSQNKKNDFYLSENGWVLEKNKNRWLVKSKNKAIIYQ